MSPQVWTGIAGLFAVLMAISFCIGCGQKKAGDAVGVFAFSVIFAAVADAIFTCSLVYFEQPSWAVLSSLGIVLPTVVVSLLCLIGKDKGTVFFFGAVVLPVGVLGFYCLLFFLTGLFAWTALVVGVFMAAVGVILLIASS